MGSLLKQYFWVLHVVFVLFLAYFLAKITNVYVASLLELPRSIAVVSQEKPSPPESVVGEFSEYQVITERNIFDATQVAAPEPVKCQPGDTRPQCQQKSHVETPVPTGEAVKTSLPIKLLSTVVIGDGKDERSTAVVEGGAGTKGPDVYAVGDDSKVFAPGVHLVQVKPRRIEFTNKGRLEYAELTEELGPSVFVPPEKLVIGTPPKTATRQPTRAREGSPSGSSVTEVEEGRYVVGQAELDAALSNLDKLYTQIRAVPNFKDGKVQGMKILSIKPGSIFAKLGLRRGDVLDRINGQQIDIKSGFQLFTQLKEQREFTLDLVRRGKSESFEYEIR